MRHVFSMCVALCMGRYLMNTRWLNLEQYMYVGSGAQSQSEIETELYAFEISKNETSRSMDSSISSSFSPTTTILRSPLIVHRHCRADAPTIVIPAVQKGLNNQRMRIVQDILVAAIMGANVELPEMLHGRVGCHYQANCYNNYTTTGAVPMWDVFDKETTLRSLEKFGICVVTPREGAGHNSTSIDDTPQPVRLTSPISSSHLSRMLETGSKLLGGRWHLGGVKDCCTKILPDSVAAADLLRQINFSFETSRIMSEAVQRVERAMQQSNQKSNGNQNNNYVAIHWRNDEDFAGKAHKLNSAAYIVAASRALENMRSTLSIASDMPLHVVVLGDLTTAALQTVEDDVNAAAVGLRGKSGSTLLFVCHSKISLVPDMNLEAISPSEDARGQVDYEIGVRAPAFIGSPFSSFSTLIAFQRSYHNNTNESGSSHHQSMIDVDTADKLAILFKLQFPYDRDGGISDHACKDMTWFFRWMVCI
jgi:hypothetical protein